MFLDTGYPVEVLKIPNAIWSDIYDTLNPNLCSSQVSIVRIFANICSPLALAEQAALNHCSMTRSCYTSTFAAMAHHVPSWLKRSP